MISSTARRASSLLGAGAAEEQHRIEDAGAQMGVAADEQLSTTVSCLNTARFWKVRRNAEAARRDVEQAARGRRP